MKLFVARVLGLGLGLLLIGCGADEGQTPGVNFRPEQGSTPDPHSPPPPPKTSFDQFCAARLKPLELADATVRHFHFQGSIIFVPNDPAQNPITQGLEISVGGPDRMKLILRDKSLAQLFFLSDAEHAWLRKSGATEATVYDSKELADDSALRWLVLRFPHSIKDHLQWPAELPKQLAINDSKNEQNPDAQASAWLLHFNDKGLLTSVSLQSDPNSPVLELSNWKAGSTGWLYPTTWVWNKDWGQLEEHFESVSDSSFFLDSFFTPLPQKGRGRNFLAESSGALSPIRIADSIDVAQMGMVWMSAENWLTLKEKPVAQKWIKHAADGSKTAIYVIENPSAEWIASHPVEKSTPTQEWLRWRSFKHLSAAQARQSLQQMALKSGRKAGAEIWLRNADESAQRGMQLYLMPVQ
ncbi:MAG: hypothetical protein H8E15_06900 [Planctomycetes bacterium]|nr:hypothetical protein [Planctomycetota bacterium]